MVQEPIWSVNAEHIPLVRPVSCPPAARGEARADPRGRRAV